MPHYDDVNNHLSTNWPRFFVYIKENIIIFRPNRAMETLENIFKSITGVFS